MYRMLFCALLLVGMPVTCFAQVLRAVPPPAPAAEPRLFCGQFVTYSDDFDGQYQQFYDYVAAHYVDRQAVSKLKPFKGHIDTAGERDLLFKELLAQLNDRWTQFYSSEDIAAAQLLQSKGLTGPGLRLDPSKEGWSVAFVFARGAAELAGLRAGDTVLEVDGIKLTPDLTRKTVDELISRKPGVDAEFTVLESGAVKPAKIRVRYLPSDTTLVEAKMLEGNVVYVRVTTFMNYQLLRQFSAALAKMQREARGRIEGIVLDLRGNTGGYMDLAFQFAGAFVNEGPIARTTGRNGRVAVDTVYSAQGYLPELLEPTPANLQLVEDLLTKPMVVLINGSSMSAAEMLTSALKDSKRAQVVGERTWGKAVSFQTIACYGGMLQLVTGTFAGPSGYNHNLQGIDPTTKVVQPRRSTRDIQLESALLALQPQAKPAMDVTPSQTSTYDQRTVLAVILCLWTLGGVLGVTAYILSSRRKRARPVVEEPDFSWAQPVDDVVRTEQPVLEAMLGCDVEEEVAGVLAEAPPEPDSALATTDRQTVLAESFYIGSPCYLCQHRFREGDIITHRSEGSGCFSYCLRCAQDSNQ